MGEPAFDVIVIGAGPAGVATAVRLQQLGVTRVRVLERYAIGRDKPCGGGLTGHCDEAMATLGLALRVPAVASHDAAVGFGGFTRRVRMGRPVKVIRRREFDADLVAQAQARGIDIRDEVAVEEVRADAQGVDVVTAAGTLRAKVVVGADGVASVVRRAVRGEADGLPHRLFMREVEAPPAWRGRHDMLYDFSPMVDGLRGYLWVFPLPDDQLNVGLMHYPAARLGGPALLQLLRDGLARHGIELPMRGARGWPVWEYQPRGRLAQDRTVLVGDAAGIDGLTGEGIAVAMEQAVIAGEHIARALARERFDFAGYRAAVRRAVVGRELTLDRRLAKLLYQPGDGWQAWMSLVLYDDDMLDMYAARVSGSEVLADQRWRLARAGLRHAWQKGSRRRALAEAMAAMRAPTATL